MSGNKETGSKSPIADLFGIGLGDGSDEDTSGDESSIVEFGKPVATKPVATTKTAEQIAADMAKRQATNIDPLRKGPHPKKTEPVGTIEAKAAVKKVDPTVATKVDPNEETREQGGGVMHWLGLAGGRKRRRKKSRKKKRKSKRNKRMARKSRRRSRSRKKRGGVYNNCSEKRGNKYYCPCPTKKGKMFGYTENKQCQKIRKERKTSVGNFWNKWYGVGPAAGNETLKDQTAEALKMYNPQFKGMTKDQVRDILNKRESFIKYYEVSKEQEDADFERRKKAEAQLKTLETSTPLGVVGAAGRDYVKTGSVLGKEGSGGAGRRRKSRRKKRRKSKKRKSRRRKKSRKRRR